MNTQTIKRIYDVFAKKAVEIFNAEGSADPLQSQAPFKLGGLSTWSDPTATSISARWNNLAIFLT